MTRQQRELQQYQGAKDSIPAQIGEIKEVELQIPADRGVNVIRIEQCCFPFGFL